MSIRVTATDNETGESSHVDVADGDYLLICTEPCHLAHTNAFDNGTHVLTVKGRTKR